METVQVTRWLKNVGETLALGEPLLEVETEKSMVEIEAGVSGRLEQILVVAGQEAKVGDQIAWVESDQSDQPEAHPSKPSSLQKPKALGASPASRLPETHSTERIRSTPAARRLLAERGLGLRGIAGTGPRGRVQLADVRAVAHGQAATSLPAANERAATMSPMQRALARAMTLSNATVPQFTVERSLDCTALQAARAQHRAGAGSKASLSVNVFLLQALARALVEMPSMNATYATDEEHSLARIVPATGTHIGLVVAIDGGLLVPVLRSMEQLGLEAIARARLDCVRRAMQGKLRSEELSGATCSLSNLGARGPDRFGAMINPPESAILAVGRQRECVVARDGGFAVRPICDLTLTVDHRIVNGKLAAEFLARVVEILETSDWRL